MNHFQPMPMTVPDFMHSSHSETHRSYSLQRFALSPLLANYQCKESLGSNAVKPITLNEEMISYIFQQGLYGHYYSLLANIPKKTTSQTKAQEMFRSRLSHDSLVYLNQRKAILTLDKILNDIGIPYIVFKGAHTREILYRPPFLRYSQDVDILVSPSDQEKVIKTLCLSGFKSIANAEKISNDIDLRLDNASIDLHWNILREGRCKDTLSDILLSDRVRYDGYFGSTPENSLFIMLIHPVFRKYLTTPYAYLSRILDIHYWINKHELDWDKIYSLLDTNSLKTAAWLTIEYYRILTNYDLPAEFIEKIKPSWHKRSYFRFWIAHNLSTKLLNWPIVTKFFFTLPAHDTFTSQLRFLSRQIILHKNARKRQDYINSIIPHDAKLL